LVWEQVRSQWQADGCPDDWWLFRKPAGHNYYPQITDDFFDAMTLAKNVNEEDCGLLFKLHDMRRSDPSIVEQLGISAAAYAGLLGNSEKVALAHYLNAPKAAETEADRAALVALLEALAPRTSPLPVLEFHESTTIDDEDGGK
jgi:hypothetical protein